MKPLVSVIVPMFNVESYIRRCLDSLEEQTYRNIEIIVINDGSKDGSLDIAKEYSRRDSRFIIISQKNGGLGKARNTGIAASRGDYVTFVDSDDYISRQYIERLMELSAMYAADVAAVNLIKFFEGQIPKCNTRYPEVISFSGMEAVEDMWYQRHLASSAWGKIYRKNLLEDIPSPEGVLYEDLGVVYRWLHRAERVVWTSEKLYYYYQRNNGIMNGEFSIKKLDRITVSRELLCWAEKLCPELQDAAEARFFLSNIQVLREIPCDDLYRHEIDNIRNNINKYRNHVIINRKVKPINRLIAAASILDVRILQQLGMLYKVIWK